MAEGQTDARPLTHFSDVAASRAYGDSWGREAPCVEARINSRDTPERTPLHAVDRGALQRIAAATEETARAVERLARETRRLADRIEHVARAAPVAPASAIPQRAAGVPPELGVMATAVLEGDVAAAKALHDALQDVEADAPNLAALWAALMVEAPLRVRRGIRKWSDVNSMPELLSRSADELLEARNFGRTSLNWLVGWLAVRGLHLRIDSPPPPAAP